MSERLTKKVVDALAARASDYVKWDGELKGFGVRVRPSGAKSFIAQYRAGGRNTPVRKVTIGAVGGGLTADQARKKAETVLARASLGQDEAAELTKARKAKTIAELCALYLEEGCENKKASTVASDRGRIARHILPLLGKKMIRDVTRIDIEQFMRDVAKGKTAVDIKTGKHGRARVTGGRGTATRTLRLLGGIFTFAVRRGYRDDNPTRGVEKYPDAKSERFLSTVEIENLGAAIREAETTGIPWEIDESKPKAKHVAKTGQSVVLSEHVAGAFRLYLFTGCRLREILKLKWSEVDIERGMLHLPDSKTGRKSVILNAPALEVLNSLSRLGAYVIAGQTAGAEDEKPRSDLKRPWQAIRKRAGLGNLRIHDLRHSFASVGAGANMGLPMIGALLGHKDVATTQRYSHLDNDPLRRASNAIGATIAAAMNGAKAAEVISIENWRRVGGNSG